MLVENSCAKIFDIRVDFPRKHIENANRSFDSTPPKTIYVQRGFARTPCVLRSSPGDVISMATEARPQSPAPAVKVLPGSCPWTPASFQSLEP